MGTMILIVIVFAILVGTFIAIRGTCWLVDQVFLFTKDQPKKQFYDVPKQSEKPKQPVKQPDVNINWEDVVPKPVVPPQPKKKKTMPVLDYRDVFKLPPGYTPIKGVPPGKRKLDI